jgi:hypothetical protein
LGSSGTSARSDEDKASTKFLALVGGITFNSGLFAYCVIHNANEVVRARVMDVIQHLIIKMAFDYAHGADQSDAGRDAMRLKDTLDSFASGDSQA